jgi:hypothetical protein
VGCVAEPVGPSRQFTQDRVRAVCWKPPELAPGTRYFVIPDGAAIAVSEKNPDFDLVIEANGIVYEYDPFAPARNLELLPLSRTDAWCTAIPKPTDEKVLRLLDACAQSTPGDQGRSVTKNYFGQLEVTPKSPFFCDQRPRTAYRTQDLLLLLARNIAYQEAYQHAHKTAMALTQAEAEMQAVINRSDSWLKRKFTSDPGTLEQIQQRVADALNAIEAPPEYDDSILDSIALAGFNAGFDNGKFEVEAKLFAIDAGILILEVVALEVALGPLGGAKLLASAVSKGGKALAQAVKRLENIPIFIPAATGGLGGVVRVGKVVSSISARMHRYYLEKAMKLPPFNRFRQSGESLHHMVAHGDDRAKRARDILDKFKIHIDEGWNGVYLPATKNSPNPNGSVVHSMVHSDKYYAKVENFLNQATSRKDAIRRLQRIRETLENGTFFDVHL